MVFSSSLSPFSQDEEMVQVCLKIIVEFDSVNVNVQSEAQGTRGRLLSLKYLSQVYMIL